MNRILEWGLSHGVDLPWDQPARLRFYQLAREAAVGSLPSVVVATVVIPLLVGVELVLIRADRLEYLLAGLAISGVHALVVLSSLAYVVSMGLDVLRALRGLAGRLLTWEKLKIALKYEERSWKAKAIGRALSPFDWANPARPLVAMVTHLAFGLHEPRLRAEYLAEFGLDRESYSLFEDEEESTIPQQAEKSWRRFSATGTSRFLTPV